MRCVVLGLRNALRCEIWCYGDMVIWPALQARAFALVSIIFRLVIVSRRGPGGGARVRIAEKNLCDKAAFFFLITQMYAHFRGASIGVQYGCIFADSGCSVGRAGANRL